jgi:hypothetical protein
MTQPYILTFCDVMEAAQDFVGYSGGTAGPTQVRRAVQAAMREVATAHPWSFFKEQGRVQLKAAESTGTIAYDHAGGATCERQLTISGDTWPSFTNDTDYGAAVKIGDALHIVQSYQSSTVLQLDPVLNPGADVAASTAMQVYPLWYKLPNDFVRFSEPQAEGLWRLGKAISHERMLGYHRYNDTTGTLRYHCVRAIPELHGAHGLFLWPPSADDETCDFMYDRLPKELRHNGLDTADRAGTVSMESNLLTVTGSDTTFASSMEGSLIRFGDASNNPTGLDGLYPFAYQQTIETVTNTESATLSQTLGGQPTSVKYVISDIIDLDANAHEAFLACVRKQLAFQLRMKDKADHMAIYKEALVRAKNADCRDMQIQVMGPRRPRRLRLKDTVTPSGP